MQAGKLRHRITFLNPVTNRQANGENVQTWTPVQSAWASINQLRGNMLALAQARTTTATATHSITIRYNPAITQTMRVRYGTTYEDFPTLTSSDFIGLTSAEFDGMEDEAGALPTIYTINQLLDPDTHRRQQTFLATVVRV